MRVLSFFAGIALVLAPVVGLAEDLVPGAKAPAIAVKKWVKGTPVKAFAPGKTYVVEFWATWCGPCITSIPHITEIAKKNKDVQFVGVSIWEENKQQEVEKFVKEMGPKMDYNVAYGGNQDGMAKTWMEAAAAQGIPTAFIVKDQKIQWIGHPMELDKPLAEVKSGKYDLAAARKAYMVQVKQVRESEAMGKEIEAINDQFYAGKRAEAKTRLDAAVKKFGKQVPADSIKFAWKAIEEPAAWEAEAIALATAKDEQKTDQLMGFAMMNGKRSPEAAAKAANLVVENAKPEDVVIFYQAGRLFADQKNYVRALELNKMALEALPKSPYAKNENLAKVLADQKAEWTKLSSSK